MADGDAAAAIGLAILNGLEKVKDMWKQINASRDMLANHITSGTHSASQITAGTLDAARIPSLSASATPGGGAAAKVASATQLVNGSAGLAWNGSDRWISSGAFGAAGNIETNAAVVASTYVQGGSGMICAATYNQSVTGGGGFRAMYVRADGLFGYVPSARRFKKNIKPAQIDPADVLKLEPVVFEYLKAYGGGHDTGLIADDVLAAGLGFLVYNDTDGQLGGIHYERLGIPLLALAKAQQAEITQLRADLDELRLLVKGTN